MRDENRTMYMLQRSILPKTHFFDQYSRVPHVCRAYTAYGPNFHICGFADTYNYSYSSLEQKMLK